MQIELVDLKTVPFELQLETRKWRNKEQVAKYFQIKHIDRATHLDWLEKINAENPTNVAFIIKCNNEYVGMTYFRNISDSADWGIYIFKSNSRGLGIGAYVLSEAITFAKYKLGLKKIFLEVLKDNIRAIKLYEKYFFKRIYENDLVYGYELAFDKSL